MKRHLLIMLLALVALTASANPITREQAQQQAEQYLANLPGSRRLAPVRNSAKLAPRRGTAAATAAQTDNELYYVFNRGENEGFIIVSGNDATLPVLGYTDEGEFDYAQLPENMRYWLESYISELQYLAEHPESAAALPIRRAAKHDKVATLCTSKWNQGGPYNNLCPLDTEGKRCVTGCVATAMAQILYYQRAKSVTEIQKTIPAYTTSGINVSAVPADSPIDWDNMTDTYSSSSTAKQNNAVAQLMLYCGVGVEMMYGSGSSGAYSYKVADAIKNYFGYGNSVKYITTSDPSTDDWDNTLYNEVAAGRPVYLSGSNDGGGHAFVCDGYDGNYCFHINWGWGGSSDGYYMLSKLNPGSQGIGGSSGGYSGYPEAVIGIEPDNYMERELPIANAMAKRLCVAQWDANGDGKLTYGEAAAVKELGEVFKGQRITTFTELYYFTGLESLGDDAFAGCTSLTTVKLPKGLKSIGARTFSGCTALKAFVLPDGVTSIGEEAFSGCRNFTFVLKPGLLSIGARAFNGCAAQTAVELPAAVTSIGDGAFAGCTKLATVALRNVTPQEITLGTGVFEGVDVAAATLNVPQGTKQYLQQADQWKEFGTIYEQRNLSQGKYVQELETSKNYYLYNVGTGYYMTKGEAYGTQAIVANTDSPMRFQLRRTTSMPEGVYYLYSDDTGGNNHIFFRITTDGKVGAGVHACFVDGTSSHTTDGTGTWKVTALGNGIFTLQTPSTSSDYNATQYLGVQTDHESNAASPTYGAYSDIVYTANAKGCQWMFVEYDAQATTTYQASLQLKNLLEIGTAKRVDTAREQAVYDDLNSDIAAIQKAQKQMRKKLNFVNFEDSNVRNIIFSTMWDTNVDGELSYDEAAAVQDIGTRFSGNTSIVSFDELKYFTGLTSLPATAFKGCTKLQSISLPSTIVTIDNQAFQSCSSLERIDLPKGIQALNLQALYSCTKLTEVRIANPDPASVTLGNTVFTTSRLAGATLYVPYGSKELYEAAATWKNFGTIKEMHSEGKAGYSTATADEPVYVYNLGQRRYLNKGEAYGTQAVVAHAPMLYQLKRSASMAEGVYYLYSTETGKDSKVLFRSNSDKTVGDGVKTCFVDGTVSAKAYWQLAPVEGQENVYTLQVPSNQSDYVEGEYLGIQTNHTTAYTSSDTYGLYYDVAYKGHETSCHWAFIRKAEADSLAAVFAHTEELRVLLATAAAQNVEATAEQAVYDDLTATEAQITNAISSLRQKLHYIDFCDEAVKRLCLNAFDEDLDDELSLEEAAAITDLGARFKSNTSIKSFEELRYFTGLTTVPAEAFRSCTQLTDIYLPANVTSIGANAFTNASALKYVAVLNPTQVVGATDAGLPQRGLTTFVPKALVDAYQADETWSKSAIEEYTGIPTVTGDAASRQYGRSNPKTTYTVTGAPINGVPVLTIESDLTTPVGDYPIAVTAGTITSPNLVCQNGVLTIEPAPVTFTAKSYTRNVGEENPEFEITYPTFRNREKADDVLIQKPVAECDATADSPAGTYEIRVSGAEAQNYVFTYVSGTLTIIDPVGVRDLNGNAEGSTLYDLSGRRIEKPAQRGLYITRGKKVAVK